MLIKKRRPWQIGENAVMPEDAYLNRRQFMKKMGILALGAGLVLSGAQDVLGQAEYEKTALPKLPKTPTSPLYPAQRNAMFSLDRPITEEEVAAHYNNFYEFSSYKNVWQHIGGLKTRPWTVEIAGLVEKPMVLDIDTLVRKMRLEERLYRLRCVEAWAMAVPWTGFPMRDFIKLVRPLSSARYVKMQTFLNKKWSLQQRLKFWLPWPYQEGLTMEEATNELTMLVTGIYGHELPPQHGAPIRLIVPWKYGFKSIKSIVRFEFTSERPQTFWNELAPEEYDFPANVDPDVPHPRWSQATERMIGTDEMRPTMKYNGYGDIVAGLYRP